jgi:hypothetical protein
MINELPQDWKWQLDLIAQKPELTTFQKLSIL